MRLPHHSPRLLAAAISACCSLAMASPTPVYDSDPLANGLPDGQLVGTNSYAKAQTFAGLLDTTKASHTATFEGYSADTTCALTGLFGGAGSLTSTKTTGCTKTDGRIQNVAVDSSGVFPGRYNTTLLPMIDANGNPILDDDGNQRTGAGKTNYAGSWWQGATSFVVDFGGTYSAFGFYATDLADFGGSLSLELLVGDTTVATLAVPIVTAPPPPAPTPDGGGTTEGDPDNGSLQFYGFTDLTQGYTGVRFVIRQSPGATSPDIIGFDDMIIGDVTPSGGTTPEPASLALVALGLIGAGAARRSQRATR